MHELFLSEVKIEAIIKNVNVTSAVRYQKSLKMHIESSWQIVEMDLNQIAAVKKKAEE